MLPLMVPCWESDDVDRTPTHNTHLCCTVCSQARNAHHALGSSHADCSVIFARLKRNCHLVLHMPHLLLLTLTCRLPRAHHLPHSLFLLTRHKNTQHNFIKCVITTNNIKCIRGAKGHRGHKKFFFSDGRERAKRGAQLCPRAVLISSSHG